MVEQNVLERVANNVGCTVADLTAHHDLIKQKHSENLIANGVTGEDLEIKTLRMASAEMRQIKARLSRSGCEMVEGMFINCHRYKDWGALAYKKMAETLKGLDEMGRTALVAQGAVALYLNDDINGGYRFVHNPSLVNKEEFHASHIERHETDLPSQAHTIGDETGHFVCIVDKSSPTWPSGTANFRYGQFRKQSEPERTCLFYGRTQGNKNMRLITVKIGGEDAKNIHPTFVAGKIPLRVGKDGNVAYAKNVVSVFSTDESINALFTEAPINADGGGPLTEFGVKVLGGLSDLKPFVEGLNDKEKWDAVCALPLEVAHIDPREGGGYIITVADLDLTSPEQPMDLYVSAIEENRVDFSVGSVLCVLGNAWVGQQGDGRMSITGWFCMESIGMQESNQETTQTQIDDDGWLNE